MKKILLFFIILYSFTLFADYLTIVQSDGVLPDNFKLYTYYDNINIGISPNKIIGKNIAISIEFDQNSHYYIIENYSFDIYIPEEFIIFKDFVHNKIIVKDNPYISSIGKLSFSQIKFNRIIKRANSPFYLYKRTKVDYTEIDSLSQYINIDSLYNTDAILSGEYSYSSGWYSPSRFVDQPGCDSAINYIYTKFQTYGFDSVFYIPFTDYFPSFFTGDSFTTKNIVAYKKGNYSSNECIVVGAHMDAVSQPYDDHTSIAPGADDNASGSSGVCEIARLFSSLDNDIDIYFVCFSGEEEGLCGSYAFIDSFIEKNSKTVKGMINMDMIAHTTSSNAVRVYGMEHSAALKNKFIEIGENITDLTFYLYGSSGGSDHYPFELAGYPAAFAIEHEFSPVYHTSSDSISYMTFSFMQNIVRTAFGTTYYLANSPSSVENIALIDNGDSSIAISWDQVPETNITNYTIYYTINEDSVVNSITIGDTNQYLLYPAFPDSLYKISVTAININNYEGLENNYDTITPSFVPHLTEITNIYSDSVSIFLNFQESQTADFNHFNIYRKIINDTIFELIDSTVLTQFEDTSINDTFIYQYTVTVVDNDSYESEYSNIENCRLITLQNNIIVFDETANNFVYPDEETDSFYSLIFSQYNIHVMDMDTVDSYNIIDFANYSKIIIIDDDLSESKVNINHLYNYIENGGKLIYIGNIIGEILLEGPDSFPAYTDSTSNAYELLNILSYNRNTNYDMDFAIYNHNGIIDTFYFDADKLPLGSNGNIMYAGIYDLDTLNIVNLSSYHSVNGDTVFDSKINAFSLDDYSTIIINYPLFPMYQTSGENLISNILSLWNIYANTEFENDIINQKITLNKIVKNTVNINFLGYVNEKISIELYDISGRKIDILFNGKIISNNMLLKKTINTPSGVYFIKIIGNNIDKNTKIIKLK